MNNQEKRDFIEKHVDLDKYYDFLIGDFGEEFRLYQDGTSNVTQADFYPIDPEERAVVSAKCVGVPNMDNISDYAGEYAEYDEDEGVWVVFETGEKIDDEELIHRVVFDGDVSDEFEEFKDSLFRSWEVDEN